MKKTMIIYSLYVHTQLQVQGFKYIGVMPNPKDDRYNCWIYEKTPELVASFNKIVKGGN